MPSVEPTAKASEQSESSSNQENASNNGQPQQQQQLEQQEQNQQSTSNGGPSEVLDPDRQLIPADRIEHVEDTAAPIELPAVREFTQNDKINKFLLNSFLQRLNETDLSRFRDGDAANGEDQEQDFEA